MTINHLIEQILRDPTAVLYGTSETVDQLVSRPSAAVDAVAQLLREGWSSEAHPKDVLEALAFLLGQLHRTSPELVDKLLVDPTLTGNHELIRWGIMAARTPVA